MPTVLVVDNEAAVCAMLTEMLRVEGHQVFEAPGASEAKRLLQRHAVDVIVMDIYMPEMNGLALMKEIKATHNRIETILISGRHSREAEATAKQFGAFSFLKKPFTRAELCDAVAEAAARSQGR